MRKASRYAIAVLLPVIVFGIGYFAYGNTADTPNDLGGFCTSLQNDPETDIGQSRIIEEVLASPDSLRPLAAFGVTSDGLSQELRDAYLLMAFFGGASECPAGEQPVVVKRLLPPDAPDQILILGPLVEFDDSPVLSGKVDPATLRQGSKYE